MKSLENLFNEIEKIIELDEIAYLKFEEGELVPVYKRNTELFTNEEWINFHKNYRTYVKDNKILKKIMDTKEICFIEDTNKLDKKPIEFEKIDVQSVYLIPVIKNDIVSGVIDIVYTGNTKRLTRLQLEKCAKVVEEHKEFLED